ncbi:GntR family transcriptional regulator [Aureimonas fodinaquatilis]|uniref:GntR family transcriptional regulator n=1 Tax=Aureimonas fodinaquatilis TaxID=2565783 RepID=A0A5B0DV11_9HYPH|nr:GntR family transcriptional regulator [Aureimonas fodinaquatilis]KAA0970604.1 GntR family transcriptional regulator [Aureimonas fodinaquatilis]
MGRPYRPGSLSHIPPYQILAEEFYRRIVNGRWPRGRILKSDALVAEEFGVSVPTVRRAFDVLEQLNLIVRLKGHRKMVGADPDKRASALMSFVDHNGDPVGGKVDIISIEKISAERAGYAARRLGHVQELLCIIRSRTYGNRIFAVETAFVVAQEQIPSLQDLRLSAAHGVVAGQIAVSKEEYACVSEPTQISASLLELDAQESVLEVRRTLLGFDEVPLEVDVTQCVLGQELRYRTA